MAKIIQISDSIVYIGVENGGIEEVRVSDFNFVPHIGDEVEIFKTDSKIIVSKIDKPKTGVPEGGININLSNTQTTTPQYVVEKGKVVNKVVYILLALFLGGIGAHKIYAGKTGAFITSLLFCWTFIPSFVALFEAIVALAKKADASGNIIV